MKENGFYKISQEFINFIQRLGGTYKDAKERPVFCCFEDRYIKDLFWAIPTSDLSHRSEKVIERVKKLCSLPENDIRYSYYFIGHTNKPAVYRISSCFPITEKYIDGEYMSQGRHLVLGSKRDISIIRKKLSRILFDENRHPNKYEQHITAIKNQLILELGSAKVAEQPTEEV